MSGFSYVIEKRYAGELCRQLSKTIICLMFAINFSFMYMCLTSCVCAFRHSVNSKMFFTDKKIPQNDIKIDLESA